MLSQKKKIIRKFTCTAQGSFIYTYFATCWQPFTALTRLYTLLLLRTVATNYLTPLPYGCDVIYARSHEQRGSTSHEILQFKVFIANNVVTCNKILKTGLE